VAVSKMSSVSSKLVSMVVVEYEDGTWEPECYLAAERSAHAGGYQALDQGCSRRMRTVRLLGVEDKRPW
jgi:hypothetical protein